MSDEPKGGGTWKDRKRAAREKFYETLRTTGLGGETPTTPESPGAAATQAVSDLDPSAWGVTPATPSSVTSALATGPGATPTSAHEPTTPVESTNSNSAPSMAWMVAPIGFVEHSLKKTIVDPSGSLVPGLPPQVLASLQALATGRSEPIADVVLQIAEFFVEEEDERAEGTLLDALTFYCLHYSPPGVTV